MANTSRKAANVNTDNARGRVEPGAQHVHPTRRAASAVTTRSVLPVRVALSNSKAMPNTAGDRDGQDFSRSHESTSAPRTDLSKGV